ncbi:MAG: hypothetical protein VKJ24_02230 [Synechococcales bacterium]|nr:hypothetical protein [Synechococcales bacterium]
MKPLRIMQGSAVAVLITAPILFSTPVGAQLTQQVSQQFSQAIAQTLAAKPTSEAAAPKVTLTLSAAKQVIKSDRQGQPVTTWQPLGNQAVAKPGETLRFQLLGKNEGKAPAKTMVLTQPIPQGTQYLLNSATSSQPADLTYSIDGGKQFTAQPKVKETLPNGKTIEKPAPASAYTHIKWQLKHALPALAQTQVSYQVTVR